MKILILSCNTGEGHNSCARAISEELERKGDWGYIADGLAFLSTGTSKFVSGWHTRLYRYFPRLYGKGYEKTYRRIQDDTAGRETAAKGHKGRRLRRRDMHPPVPGNDGDGSGEKRHCDDTRLLCSY